MEANVNSKYLLFQIPDPESCKQGTCIFLTHKSCDVVIVICLGVAPPIGCSASIDGTTLIVACTGNMDANNVQCVSDGGAPQPCKE